MCIFCGGACGGIGDMLLPTIATGAGLVMLKIKARREIYKRPGHNRESNNKGMEKSIPESAEQSNNKDQ